MTIQSKSINKGVIREFVIPVKKHLAKFIIAGKPKFENPENPKQMIVYYWIDTLPVWHTKVDSRLIIQFITQYFYDESLLLKNWFVSAKYYRKRNFRIEDRLFPYLNKNYTFLKIKINISSNKFTQIDSTYFKRLTFDQLVNSFNRMIENNFLDICGKYLCCQTNKTKAIEEIFIRLNIKESEIKKESILRKLKRNKKIKSESVYFENLTNEMIISYLNNL